MTVVGSPLQFLLICSGCSIKKVTVDTSYKSKIFIFTIPLFNLVSSAVLNVIVYVDAASDCMTWYHIYIDALKLQMLNHS